MISRSWEKMLKRWKQHPTEQTSHPIKKGSLAALLGVCQDEVSLGMPTRDV